MDAQTVYADLESRYRAKAQSLKQQSGWLSLLRLLFFCGFIFLGYQSIATGSTWAIIGMLLLLAAFLIMIRVYDQVQQKTAFYKALVKLNADEISFLKGNPSVYSTGKEYTDPHHAYSYDLDMFGEGGLFPYLNRCSTSFGKEALASALLHPVTEQITERQEAVIELRDRLEFRQYLQAHGSLLDTREKELQQMKDWLQKPASFRDRRLYYLLMLFPLASSSCLIYYFVSEQEGALSLFYDLFILNLVVAVSFSRRISAHLSVSTSVTKILQQFAGQLKQVEGQSFNSPLLQGLQEGLKAGNEPASVSLFRLSSLFNYLETIVNLLVSMLLNGLFLFHIHILYRLESWKQKHGDKVILWLKLLGEIEGLNSMANLAYNNRSFCRPVVSEEEVVIAENMGHPLIRAGRRVNNSISFSSQRFVILTGSNMSGKSTFLRTLGVNLVLARSGSMVCADQFVFYPFLVQVSMRITDSLQDSESFFYAELKRLHSIIAELEAGEKSFIILDEILRGTNSNDKHNGTVGLIRKLVRARACGIIATHDLTVSELAMADPGYISNKCFESEIINDELVFDYKLKEGVCTRLSASFLMEKMGIIDKS